MKSHTDLSQSKTLSEFLSHKSADMYYWCGEDLRIGGYKAMDIDYDTPCWSLAALLDVLPNNQGRYTKSLYWFDDAWFCEYVDEDGAGILGTSADNPIDACYEMIIKLHELKML